jgi:hypothetical protein
MVDPKPTYSLSAPGTGAASRHCPAEDEGQDEWPALDDHLVDPETSREEVVRGERYEAVPANPEHAIPHAQLDYVARAHAAAGYTSATDMLTRFGRRSDFAPDTAIVRVDTGARCLEELVFEVVKEQPLHGPKGINAKAEEMVARGVRRVFGVFVKEGALKEWVSLDDLFTSGRPLATSVMSMDPGGPARAQKDQRQQPDQAAHYRTPVAFWRR